MQDITRARICSSLAVARNRLSRLTEVWSGAASPLAITWLRTASTLAQIGIWASDPTGAWPVVTRPLLCCLAVDLAGGLPNAKPEFWDKTWIELAGRPIEVTHIGAVPSSITCEGGEARLVSAVRDELARATPAALLSGSIGADLPNLVRRLTSTEAKLEERLSKYLDAGVHRSVLFYGPPSSAKTSAACSIAMRLVGSYVRLHASRLTVETADALCMLRPMAVVVDDLDRCTNTDEILDLLQRLADTVPLVFATANVRQNIDAAGQAPHRLNLHIEVAGLDPEAQREVAIAAGIGGIDLGPEADALLAGELIELGKRFRAGDLAKPAAAVRELLDRRTRGAVPTETA